VEWNYSAEGISPAISEPLAASDSSFCARALRSLARSPLFAQRNPPGYTHNYLAAGVHISSLFVLCPRSAGARTPHTERAATLAQFSIIITSRLE
jgi:hypothetical protein